MKGKGKGKGKGKREKGKGKKKKEKRTEYPGNITAQQVRNLTTSVLSLQIPFIHPSH